ncbi:MAG: amidase [Actinomycetia bacterium]|nr:amidase [Actinomycetes bacterium]
MDFLSDSVEAIASRVRAGEQSAREVTQHAIDRIEALNPRLNAFVAWDGERALAQADAIDAAVAAGGDPGPLAGVPMGVKDLEAVEGFTTSFGSALHAGDAPAHADSVHVARYRAAGAVIMGKTNTPEYGHKGATDNVPFGQTVNPWSDQHSPGGSSGGTATALASGMVPLGTGSDGGGSIRIPASLCGLSGLKTETARIPITGRAMPGSGLLSANGPMGRSALDSAVALDAVVGPDGRDPLSLPHPGESWAERVRTAEPPARVVWAPTFGFAEVDAEVAASCRATVDALAAAGTEVIELDSIFGEDPVDQWVVLWVVSRFKAQGHLIDTPEWDKVSDSIKPQIMMGANVSGVDFMRAQDACYALNWQVEDALDQAPLILCPTAAGQAPRLGEDGTINGQADVGWVKFTYGINMTRHPAGSVCTGLTEAGTPIGLQVIGRHQAEGDVLAAMAALETTISFDARPPERGQTPFS